MMLIVPEEHSKEEEIDDWLHGTTDGDGDGEGVGEGEMGLILNARMVGMSAKIIALSTTYSIEEGVRSLPVGVVNAF